MDSGSVSGNGFRPSRSQRYVDTNGILSVPEQDPWASRAAQPCLAQQHLAHHEAAVGTGVTHVGATNASIGTGWALRFDALGGAEILQQGHPIFATEINELNVLHTIVEEDALAVGINAAIGAVQIVDQGAWHIGGSGLLATGAHNAPGKLQ